MGSSSPHLLFIHTKCNKRNKYNFICYVDSSLTFPPFEGVPTKKMTGLGFSEDKRVAAVCCRQVLTRMYFFHGPYCVCFHDRESLMAIKHLLKACSARVP